MAHAIDTLRITRKLESAGVDRHQAEAHAEALNEVFVTRFSELATKADLERLPTREEMERFATKEDLKRFPTKEDLHDILKGFATKEDLKRFPTKEDLHDILKGFATKEDLKRFPTKEDLHEVLKGFATKEDLKQFPTKEDLHDILKGFATKEDLKQFPTKEDLHDILKGFATKEDLKQFPTRAELEAGLANLEKEDVPAVGRLDGDPGHTHRQHAVHGRLTCRRIDRRSAPPAMPPSPYARRTARADTRRKRQPRSTAARVAPTATAIIRPGAPIARGTASQ